jgi:ribosomal protein L3 glutamine methyltransferase
MALAGGEDGLDAVRGIVKDAPRFLNPGGLLVVEVGHGRAAVESAFPRMPVVWLETAGHDEGVFAIDREAIVAGR